MEIVIKIIAGPEKGQEFACAGAETIVGRSPRCAIRLTSASVSYEHAIISRAGEDYVLENLSANGTFLNNERISTKTRLRLKDRFRIGEETVARVMLTPAASTHAYWMGVKGRFFLKFVLPLMAVALVVMAVVISGSDEANLNWPRAYTRLLEFAQRQVAAGKLPRDTDNLLQEAWRLETSKDRPDARKAWLRLRAVLVSTEPTTGYVTSATNYPRALVNLANSKVTAAPTEEELGAALVEFASAMEKKK